MHAEDPAKKNHFLNEFKQAAIRKIRDRKLSISELARITGIKQSTLHKGLYDARELTFSNASAISNALDISLAGNNPPTNNRMAPVITSLAQLDSLHHASQPVWDEYVLLEQMAEENILAIDQSLFRPAIFPDRSVLLIQTEIKHGVNLAYLNHSYLALSNIGHPPLGKIIGITFRKNK
ncbi:helix-turn-helix domain-containing protein [Chromobacterium sphagni]|uniref:HTH cro/C1-type domain-containing protein n=1 Tax=Chromobacterium sphagni TaxID=1903179 RepID=A0ABX3CH40_9NEIS|nr:helix-turn-helix transcriptional regulator [Chromobacterium sphagni]OHX21464.1 hypothetical protein BI344_02735 [Chromobacterium sphagni]